MRLPSIALPPILLAAVLMAPGACGQATSDNADDFQGAEREVAETVFEFRDAVAQRDQAKVCDSFFTADLRDEIVRVGKAAGRGSTCVQVVEDSIRAIDATQVEIPDGGIEIDGDTATVKIRTDLTDGQDPVDELTLTNERGWRISELPQ